IAGAPQQRNAVATEQSGVEPVLPVGGGIERASADDRLRPDSEMRERNPDRDDPEHDEEALKQPPHRHEIQCTTVRSRWIEAVGDPPHVSDDTPRRVKKLSIACGFSFCGRSAPLRRSVAGPRGGARSRENRSHAGTSVCPIGGWHRRNASIRRIGRPRVTARHAGILGPSPGGGGSNRLTAWVRSSSLAGFTPAEWK